MVLPKLTGNRPQRVGMKTRWILLILLSTSITGPGCLTPMEKLDNVRKLTEHPQFPVAAREAPEFTREALRKVAELEYQIERR